MASKLEVFLDDSGADFSGACSESSGELCARKKPMTRLMKLLGGELAWHVGRSYNDMPWDSQTFRIIS